MPYRGVLLDLAGVLYVAEQPLPGARAALARLRSSPLALRFVTNTSRRTRAALLGALQAMGFDVDAHEVFTAPLAARRWLTTRGLRPLLLIHPDLAADFAGLPTESPNAVFVADAAEHFDYRHLNRAFRVLIEGAPLVAVARNRYFREADGLSLDAGPFVAALEYAAGAEAVVIGKPAAAFYHEAVAEMGLAPGDVVMVGDDVEADVLGALDAGLAGILVRTGKYRPGDEERLAGTRGVTVASLTEAVEAILNR